MALKADKDGFLIGESIAGEDPAAKWMAAIKGDTASILALLKSGARTARPVAVPSGRSSPASRAHAAAMPAASRSAAVPAPRSTLARDPATGRFVSAPRPTVERAREQRAVQAATQTAEAVAAMARTDEVRRRDEKAAERAAGQARGANGRFGAGGAGGGAGGIGGSLGAAGGAIGDVQQIDPLLGAASEIGGMLATAKEVVTPLGRAFNGGGGDDGGGGWLRKMWRELRLMRRDDAQQSRTEVRKLADLAKMGRGGDGGGGLMSFILPMLGRMLLPALATIGTAVAAFFGAGSVLYKWISEPLGKVVDYFASLDLGAKFSNAWGAATQFVVDVFTPARKLFNELYDWVGTLPGVAKVREMSAKAAEAAISIGGRALDATRGMAATAVDVVKGYTGRALGWVSKKFESGNGGAGTISTGKGDLGGKSYGTHQLASKTGTLQKFLASSPYGAQFAGLTPGSPEFDAKWKSLAGDKGFAAAQQDFIRRTHFDPQMARLKKGGIDLSGRGAAVQEAVFSTSTQFGANSSLIQKALAGKDVAGMSDAQIVAAIQDHKIANNAGLFRSSSDKVRAGTLARAQREKALLLGMATTGGTVAAPRIAGMPAVPSPPAAPAVPQMPATTSAGPQRLSSAPVQAPAAQPAVITQDVPDRTIAHIVTGGIGAGAGYAHR